MDTETKLSLLRTATALPFTHKPALLSHLAAKFPALETAEMEGFLDSVLDFALIQRRKSIEPVTLEPSEEEESSQAGSVEPEIISMISPQVESARSSPSPLLIVKTPSGRTLRSAATLNTSEPRRLRNSSIGTANITFNKQS